MNEYEKEYIECRLILLGSEKVGKKSFIKRVLSMPSTSTIRDTENENIYKEQILRIRRLYEKQKKYLEMLKEMSKEFIKNEYKNKSKYLNKDNKSLSKGQEKKYKKIEKNNNSFIMKVSSEELFFSKDYIRPPIPEHPSKLFNIHKSKICIKPFYILPAEKISYDYNPTEDDSDNDIDNELNIYSKGIKNDIKRLLNDRKTIIEKDRLNGYKITIYNIFLFIYELSDFHSFELLLHYYNLLEDTFNLSSLNNTLICIVGNKKDQKIPLHSEQELIFKDFMKKNKFPFFEISTKPYFNFEKFFLEFLFKNLSKSHEKLFNEYNFKLDFEKIVENKSTFSKSLREINPQKESNPGPNYDVNIYSFNSMKELNETLNNHKFRFNKKIFYNKIGPKFMSSKSIKELSSTQSDILKFQNNPFLFKEKGGILNKHIEGYTFGIKKGRLDLLKERKNLTLKRFESLKEFIEGDSSLIFKNSDNKVKGDEYLEQATERRKKFFEKRVIERKVIINKLAEIHNKNIEKIEKEEKKKKIIVLSGNKKSLSSSNIFPNKIIKKEIENNKKRYLESIYPKNKFYLKEYNKILKKINSSKREYISPGPNAYDIRNNYTDRSKGPTIAGKRKEIILSRSDPSFPDLRDEFDIIAEKATRFIKRDYEPRFKQIKREKEKGPYPNEEIWKKWETNRERIYKKGKIKKFIQELKKKKDEQLMKMEELKLQNEEMNKLRKEILIKKGYEDPDTIKSINYSLVEESSPKYTIKGRHSINYIENNKANLSSIYNEGYYKNKLMKNEQLNMPLPDFNIVKPKLPSIIFSKANRFNYNNKEYEGSMDLFKDGTFGLKTQENFSNKEPFSYCGKRYNDYNKTQKSPSPADYKIKSSFELIAENGKKISEIRDKIKMNEQNRKNKINENELIDNLKGKNKKEKIIKKEDIEKEEENNNRINIENENNNNKED